MVVELDLSKLFEDVKKTELGETKELIIYDARTTQFNAFLLTVENNKAVVYTCPLSICTELIYLLEKYPAIKIRAYVQLRRITAIEDIKPLEKIEGLNLLEIRAEPSIDFVRLTINGIEMRVYSNSVKSYLLQSRILGETVIRAFPVYVKTPTGVISVRYLIWDHEVFGEEELGEGIELKHPGEKSDEEQDQQGQRETQQQESTKEWYEQMLKQGGDGQVG